MTKKRKYEKEYEEYCNNLLEQLKLGGMNKLEIFKVKAIYKNSKKAYDDFVELYENKDEIEVTFTPDEN